MRKTAAHTIVHECMDTMKEMVEARTLAQEVDIKWPFRYGGEKDIKSSETSTADRNRTSPEKKTKELG